MNRVPSELAPLIGQLHNVTAELRFEVLTTQPHTDLYLRNDFILMCFGNTVKTKEIQFLSFSRKIRPFWKKFLQHQLHYMMIETSAKFAPLNFINRNDRETQVFHPNQTSLLWRRQANVYYGWNHIINRLPGT